MADRRDAYAQSLFLLPCHACIWTYIFLLEIKKEKRTHCIHGNCAVAQYKSQMQYPVYVNPRAQNDRIMDVQRVEVPHCVLQDVITDSEISASPVRGRTVRCIFTGCNLYTDAKVCSAYMSPFSSFHLVCAPVSNKFWWGHLAIAIYTKWKYCLSAQTYRDIDVITWNGFSLQTAIGTLRATTLLLAMGLRLKNGNIELNGE